LHLKAVVAVVAQLAQLVMVAVVVTAHNNQAPAVVEVAGPMAVVMHSQVYY
jgi:hypothetical protein